MLAFFLCLVCVVSAARSEAFSGDYDEGAGYDVDDLFSAYSVDAGASSECVPRPLGGVKWILSVQGEDKGWREETHRAVVALAVSGWRRAAHPDDVRQVDLQLEVELTRALLRNTSSPLHPNDLALYVHALLATQRNPRNFYGLDLVSRLQDITSPHQIHPFLLLALCNGGAISRHNLPFAEWLRMNQLPSTQSPEYLAMSLNAYECLKSDSFQKHDESKNEAIKRLLAGQLADGSFGNVYTTSLIVQALSGYESWGERRAALDYLRGQSASDVNMVSTYLIQLALNADRVRFIRDLHPGLKLDRLSAQPEANLHYVHYTIRIGLRPEVYHTMTIKIPESATLYDIMEMSAKQDPKFNYSSYPDRSGDPSLFAVSGVPNDAEENLYWRVCLQTDVDHDRHTSSMRTVHGSPVKFVPQKNSYIILWYMQSECEDQHLQQ